MRKELTIPFDLKTATKIANKFGTPIYIYNEAGIRATARELNHAFSWAKDYKNYFAVKANPNPTILKILHEEGMGFDCSSFAELTIMQRMGIGGKDIFFSSNNTPKEDFELAIELGATVNIDDLSQVPVFLDALAGRHLNRVAARYNPGNLKQGNTIIGEPKDAKFGMKLEALVKAFKQLKDQNIDQFGLHTMVASSVLDSGYFEETAEVVFSAVEHIQKATGVVFNFINLGGGFGINYKPQDSPIDSQKTAKLIQETFKKHHSTISLYTEHGRFVTGSSGYLLSRVRYIMHKYKTFVGLDASMHNLMRPGMYKAYHHITILGKEKSQSTQTYDVVGSLCENNDKFAIDRRLPDVKAGDLVVIHDVGSHGHTMGFNYNGLLRSAEVLLTKSGEVELIRRAETVDDYLKNVVWLN